MSAFPQPTEIRRDGNHIFVSWADGHQSDFTTHYLRCSCQCAACVDEWSREPLLDPNQVPRDVKADTISVVGSYAIQPAWSDGHSSGIFSFTLLRSLCPCEACQKEKETASA